MIEPKQKVFLSAEWKNLVLVNFQVPDALLLPYLPTGCELDRYQGQAFVSLVAFQFLETAVFGIKWPGFSNFPEINLRFYVRYQGRRGVVFIKEFVPSRMVAGIARYLYNEPYQAAAMTDSVNITNAEIKVGYSLKYRGHSMSTDLVAGIDTSLPAEDSLEHFFKEHELGVGRDRKGNSISYEVSHPFWRVFAVQSFQYEVDWAGLYGPEFEFLKSQKPASVVFAAGSEICVYWKSKNRIS